MKKKEYMQVSDLAEVLKNMEGMVKNPKFLITGREISNFALRPREALANWLICAVGNYNGFDLTFMEDRDGGDGIIFDKTTKTGTLTEHVMAINPPNTTPAPNGNNAILAEMQKKFDRGKPYAEGKGLVVFIEGMNEYHPRKLSRLIRGKHFFGSVWLVALLYSDKKEYCYTVMSLSMPVLDPIVYKVHIVYDFTSWCVEIIPPQTLIFA